MFCVFSSYYRVGLDIPTIEVRYQNLKIDAEAFVGGRALPSFINAITNVVEVRSDLKLYYFIKWLKLFFSFLDVLFFCY